MQQYPEPRASVRHRSRQEKARKYIADQIKVPEKLPPGPLQIVISIRKQQLTLYAGGQPVAHSQVSTGVPGHPTPQGVFSIIQKQIYHEFNLYSSAPMPYMQRITWSGVAMHQGVVPGRPASHGCIRLPAAFAKRLWSLTRIGARVIIAQDDVALGRHRQSAPVRAAPGPGVSAELPARQGAGMRRSRVSPTRHSRARSIARERGSKVRSTGWCRPAWPSPTPLTARTTRSRLRSRSPGLP